MAKAQVKQPPEHRCYVHNTAKGWRIVCRKCGMFGPVCDTPEEAESIADRHVEVGGFER